jgi:NhaP-type Na+/H+ or K+/H+ antiporter
MPRAGTLRVIGWLLTPFVVWAAAFLGSTGAARVGGPTTSLAVVIGAGIVLGGLVAALWVWLLQRRRVPPPR